MRNIILVGGAGYIGTRLSHALSAEGIPHDVVDVDVFEMWDGQKRDVDALPDEYFAGAVVVYLASFHREPDSVRDVQAWRNAYEKLMEPHPRIYSSAFHTIYVSSMRAITEDRSIYATVKRQTEAALLHFDVSIVRFGTVWGGLDPELPSRCRTAVNHALIHKEFIGDHWTAFTTHMDLAVRELTHTVINLSDHLLTPTAHHVCAQEIANVTDTPIPLTAGDLRSLLEGTLPVPHLQATFDREIERTPRNLLDLTQDVRAAQNLARLYGLQWPLGEG